MQTDVDKLSHSYELLKKAVTGGSFPDKAASVQQNSEIARASRGLNLEIYKFQLKVNGLQ